MEPGPHHTVGDNRDQPQGHCGDRTTVLPPQGNKDLWCTRSTAGRPRNGRRRVSRSAGHPAGTGPGVHTRDGCAVEVYRRLPAGEDLHIVHLVAGQAATILDLGAGAGRLADPLGRLGHQIVAVDDSSEMLSCIAHAQAVCSRIEDLYLDAHFDVVVLASHLINKPDERSRHQLLQAIARHLAPGGRALIQWHPPIWFDGLAPGAVVDDVVGDVQIRFAVDDRREEGALLDATVTYTVDSSAWTHAFTARKIALRDLQLQAQTVGLEVHTPSDPAVTWLLATCLVA